ncbi:MAG: hypothetical protein QXO15_00280 [Nitrososphaerota archaeon]
MPHTRIHEKSLKKLGIKPINKTIVVSANGKKVKRDVGYAEVIFRGRRAIIPVVFGKDGEEEVLGRCAALQLSLGPLRIQGGLLGESMDSPSGGISPYKIIETKDCAAARKSILRAGLIAVYYGRNPLSGRHIFCPIPAPLAEGLARGEAINIDRVDREGLAVLEEMRVLGYLEAEGGVYRIKSEDLERDLKIQLNEHRRLCIGMLVGLSI